jgi:hypothetical protein
MPVTLTDLPSPAFLSPNAAAAKARSTSSPAIGAVLNVTLAAVVPFIHLWLLVQCGDGLPRRISSTLQERVARVSVGRRT